MFYKSLFLTIVLIVSYVLSNSTNISYCWKSALQAVETCEVHTLI